MVFLYGKSLIAKDNGLKLGIMFGSNFQARQLYCDINSFAIASLSQPKMPSATRWWIIPLTNGTIRSVQIQQTDFGSTDFICLAILNRVWV